MHVCFICHEFPGSPSVQVGGIGFFLKTFTQLLVQKGIKVSIVGVYPAGSTQTEFVDGLRIVRVGRSSFRFVGWWENMKKLNEAIDAIHREDPIDILEAPELDLAFVRKNKDISYVIRLHGGHHFFAEAEKRKINFWKGYQEKVSFGKADAFIAVSDYVRQHTFKFFELGDRPIRKIFGMIDLDKFSLKEKQIKKNKLEVIFAGTVCEKKGVKPLIHAVNELKNEFPGLKLKIYGREWFFSDGKSYQQHLMEYFPESYFENVFFMGPVAHQELPLIFSKSHVCVFPSFMETQGLVVSEAMATKSMVVYTSLGPGKELVSHGENGFVADPNKVDELKTVLAQVLNMGFDDKFWKICENAQTFVNQAFDPHTLLNSNLDFYRQVKGVRNG
ncbi:glycosyltransferase family 4 protein [Algoriphagus hitonicola]|uniref:Glycosyltransferase involved in cell wall bisynthesis n=1 Tax=Algoriphagus hitonicola TaxID=435880 RepID=A0A1I2X3X0_9BACT|nr:glycosyltransferase family 4 protein [Algoriphagus hitonicola]SFH08220.1 Glycosyltransferase involved in cell wall bisynthesis [Algoriphagus hitonicola]